VTFYLYFWIVASFSGSPNGVLLPGYLPTVHSVLYPGGRADGLLSGNTYLLVHDRLPPLCPPAVLYSVQCTVGRGGCGRPEPVWSPIVYRSTLAAADSVIITRFL
jgi:hypothetical protein